jgi:hypothetical protein
MTVATLRRGKCRPLGEEKAVRSDAQGGVVMKAAPAATFAMAE